MIAPRREAEGDGPAAAVGDHASLCAVAAPGAAKRLTAVTFLAVAHHLFRTRRLVVRTDGGAVEESHAEGDAALLDQAEEALPDAEPGPADEGLRRLPPGPEFGRDAPPLGAVLVPPEDRRTCSSPVSLGAGREASTQRLT